MLDTNPTRSVTTPPPSAINISYLLNLFVNKKSLNYYAKCKFFAPSPVGIINVIALGNAFTNFYR